MIDVIREKAIGIIATLMTAAIVGSTGALVRNEVTDAKQTVAIEALSKVPDKLEEIHKDLGVIQGKLAIIESHVDDNYPPK